MRQFILFLFSILTLAVLVWAVVQGYRLLSQEQKLLNDQTQALFILGVIILLVITFSITSTIRYAAKTMAGRPNGILKCQVYEDVLLHLNSPKEEGDNDSLSQFKPGELRIRIGLLGGQAVLKALNEIMDEEYSKPNKSTSYEEKMEKLVLAMRAELGHRSYYPDKKEIKKLLNHHF